MLLGRSRVKCINPLTKETLKYHQNKAVRGGRGQVRALELSHKSCSKIQTNSFEIRKVNLRDNTSVHMHTDSLMIYFTIDFYIMYSYE